MSTLILKDLAENVELDAAAMASVRGGLNAVINNSQQANQNVVGGFGPITAFNSPVSAPSTVLTEANPVTRVDLNTFNLVGSAQNFIGAF
ncbi:hypothetical protein [Thiothrix nivea]|uniref:Uncharacterized protein n=1 Tax=Thiothrix nivea (strain ATCC 35100 / DSM 5205 / JP2) TaxID=870187 RepID=A0A656HLD0_THINJ|nr:hypothetical protein [Thiothrix nivea]EIJ37052.1 hypothetical protein Thini_0039 [Thiothrix nivea DSM 5205]